MFNKYNGDRQAQGQSDTQAAFRQTHTAEITDRPVNINYEQTEDIEERSGEFKLGLFWIKLIKEKTMISFHDVKQMHFHTSEVMVMYVCM